MSLYRRFNKWKNRDWVNEDSLGHEELDYYKVLEQIPNDLREKLCYADEKWSHKSKQIEAILRLLLFGGGLFFGWLIASGYYDFIASLNSVLP